MQSLFDLPTIEGAAIGTAPLAAPITEAAPLPSLFALLCDLGRRGFSMRVEALPDGETLFVKPARWLSNADGAAIKRHKPALVAVVKLRDYERTVRAGGCQPDAVRRLLELRSKAERLCGRCLSTAGHPLKVAAPCGNSYAGAAYRDGAAHRAEINARIIESAGPDGEREAA